MISPLASVLSEPHRGSCALKSPRIRALFTDLTDRLGADEVDPWTSSVCNLVVVLVLVVVVEESTDPLDRSGLIFALL